MKSGLKNGAAVKHIFRWCPPGKRESPGLTDGQRRAFDGNMWSRFLSVYQTGQPRDEEREHHDQDNGNGLAEDKLNHSPVNV